MSPISQFLFRSSLCVLLGIASLESKAAYTPKVVSTTTSTTLPYKLTGLIWCTDAGSQGSGAVVRYPRVVISCAHVVYENGWKNGNYFFQGRNSGKMPLLSEGKLMRGYWNFSSYSGELSNLAFSKDFVAHYGYEDLAGGSYGGWFEDGAAALKSNRSKMITGYPAGLYPLNHRDEFRMHQTGPFSLRFSQEDYPTYLGVEEVSTGPGNSGGPIWVNDSGQWRFSGVVISGLMRSEGDPIDATGVFAMNGAAWGLVDKACISAGGFIPQIGTPPSNVYAYLGENARLVASASGAPAPSLRWQINSGGGWFDLFEGNGYSGTGSGTLTVYNISSAHGAVSYRLSASNIAGTAYSSAAQVIPVAPPPPVITKHPVGQTVVAGSDAVLTVEATGLGILKYQWRKDGFAIPGATRTSYGLGNVQTSRTGNYRVEVSNAGGMVRSQIAVFTVLGRYFISTAVFPNNESGTITTSPEQPAGGYLSGTTVTLTATATGTNQFYGWSGVSGTSNQLVFKITSNKAIGAHFHNSRLVWQHSDGRLATWFMDGTDFLGATALKKLGPGWRTVCTHDFNQDGSLDFLLQNVDGRVATWEMDRNNFSSAVLVRKVGAMWRAVGIADANDDGQGDIYFQNTDNRLAVWHMDGSTFVESVLIREGVPIGAGWQAIAVHDFDENGSPDIIFQHSSNGRIAIWLMDGTNLQSAVKVRDGLGSGNWKLRGLGDFNGDSEMDLIMQNTDGRSGIWFMDGVTFTGNQVLRYGIKIGAGWNIIGTK